MEKILCASIHFNDQQIYEHQPVNIKTGFVVCGHRHHNCFMTLFILNPKLEKQNNKTKDRNITQGFITNKNRFVDRKEGFDIALKANQVLQNTERTIKQLFSEDLY